MKKFLTASLVLLTASFAFAMPYWAAIETTGYEDARAEGVNDVASYSMYYCTLDAANTMFKGTSVSAIESYLGASASNFEAAKALAITFDSVGYSDGMYNIIDQGNTAFADDKYVAIAFYGSEAYRVYGYNSEKSNSGELTPYGQLVFNELFADSGTVGEWTVSVPEPTSGLLLLLGLSALALKRKQA